MYNLMTWPTTYDELTTETHVNKLQQQHHNVLKMRHTTLVPS